MNREQSAPKKQGCHELTSFEKRALSQIFKVILRSGRVPTIDELRRFLKEADDDVIRVLDKLAEKDLLLRRTGTQQMVSIYPLSLEPTKHQVVLEDGKKLFAMCAVDAVGLPNMFNKDVEVISECGWCKEKITLEIKNGEVVAKSHPQVVIWNLERQEGPSAETCCPVINFFCSSEHLREWEELHPDLSKKGHSDLLEQAYPGIKKRWRRYGETIGVR